MKKLRQAWERARQRLRRMLSWVYYLPHLHPVLSVVGKTATNFFRDDCHIMAASISFYSILSLIPFMLMLMSVAGYVFNHMGQDYASSDELFAHLTTYFRAVIPFLGDDVLERLRNITSNREAYGITGLVILLLTAHLVFRTMEVAFGRVFKVTQHRPLVVSQLLFVVFFLAVGLLFLSVHYLGVLSSSFYSARDLAFDQRLNEFLSQHVFLRLVASIVTAVLVFVVLLKYFSYARVRLRYAFYGGLLFSLLWLLAVRIFGYYLTHIARFSLLYGSLATLAIIVVWIFYSSCILLLCSEFTCVLQTRTQAATLNPTGASPTGL